MPAHIPPQHGASAAVDSGVAFARRWPRGHAMADMSTPNEEPCGEYLMLWDAHQSQSQRGDTGNRTGRFLLRAALLHASTGEAAVRKLLAPEAVTEAFDHGGIAAIDYNGASGVVAVQDLELRC